MDLAEWYAARRWVALLELIDMLPTACRLNEAIANDPEMAAHLAQQRLARKDDDADPWSPPLSEYDLNVTLLREILHAVKGLRQVSIAAAGGKPGHEEPFPAPRTEIDRAFEAAEKAWAQTLVQQFGFSPGDV
ncbi:MULTISPECIES: hypothetical protein [Arthrobacter]|uniref:Uncharacterized protein n=1 Tax=Arthrobacter terricola TaxID=2547396 RepID=A0A4R5KC13_9MICC|nr:MULTISPECIES: hypothetical protein [Arthrobacter]MBT8162792.1 hypothetical protein [Arthrobacter sp. GN70]TDF92048.1 hypothetical protein E1809_18890 [Arthrobacter terricola]